MNGIEHTIKDEIRQIFIYEVLFFLFLNFIIYFFYKNFLKADLYKKLNRIKAFLESGKDKKEIYLGDDQWILQFWRVVKAWQQENLSNISKLDKEKEILTKIISAVDSAIILLDKDFNFTVKNNNLLYLFERSKYNCIQGIKYIEIIEVIREAQLKNKDIKKEIYIQDLKKYFLITVKKLDSREEYLLSIKDMTPAREIVEVQRKFISNVSHELKTPLTNIKGYLIALKDAPDSVKENFINIIERNIDKMENIIVDFLNISKMESLNIINISQVSEEKLSTFLKESVQGIIKKKNGFLEFKFELLEKDSYLQIDFEKITMILKNLIENGFIYNHSENPKVTVNIYEMRKTYKIIVQDNGIGIEKNKIDKIFERFYRVDKARTSNVAGTGLGLSIVKEIIKNYEGEIKVLSEEGKGSTFIISIPK
ncbi:sensor histidine kinase [Cetobacterium sp. SF1]|uniref:sensor histidine kinase n=1 Tax=Cetobacterium sp. SF1 TaxID=3417654 RepID=UPI003CF36E1E